MHKYKYTNIKIHKYTKKHKYTNTNCTGEILPHFLYTDCAFSADGWGKMPTPSDEFIFNKETTLLS